jgi:hypothetical protein
MVQQTKLRTTQWRNNAEEIQCSLYSGH